jgi:hypothetical protein
VLRENRTRGPDNTNYKLIILLVALTAAFNAIRDLNRLCDLASSVEEITSSLLENGLTVVYANNRTVDVSPCLVDDLQADSSTDRFRWSGRVAPGKSVEIKAINGDISAKPTAGAEIEVVASKQAHRSDTSTVEIKVVEHPGGVMICAVYPSDDPDQYPSQAFRLNHDLK